MRIIIYRAQGNVPAPCRLVALPCLDGEVDPLPVPFFGETAEQAEVYARKFMEEEFAPAKEAMGIMFQ